MRLGVLAFRKALKASHANRRRKCAVDKANKKLDFCVGGWYHSREMDITLSPLEPLYSLRVAAEIIPYSSVGALTQFLHYRKAEFPARYRKMRGGHEIRLLTESEVLKIREMTLLTPEQASAGGRRRSTKRSSNLVEIMVRRCANA